jgi:hypothetical protein
VTTRIDMAFFERFFGPGNDIRWAIIQPGSSGAIAEALQPFLREATSDGEYLLLPRRAGHRLWWYAMARDARGARILRDELLAFVGPSYSSFWGEYARLDPSDPVEQAVLGLAGRHAFRIEVTDPSHRDTCRKMLQRMLEVRSRRRHHARTAPRPTGQILRDFELAMQGGHRTDAEGYLDELRKRSTLSARNLMFLQVHLYDCFGEWTALSMILEDGALVQARRPLRVTRALIRAVYQRELARFEDSAKPSEALRHFEDVVQPRFGRLYRSIAGLAGPMVTKSLLLAAAAFERTNTARRDELLARYPSDAADRDYVEALGALFVEPAVETLTASVDRIAEARGHFADGDLDAAMSGLLICEPTALVLELIIRCALELGTLDAKQAALTAFADAPEAVRQAVAHKPRVKRALSELRSLFASELDAESSVPRTEANDTTSMFPRTWVDWFDRLKREPSWAGAVEVAAQAASEWSIDELTRTAGALDAIAERLESNFSDLAGERLSEALPHLLEFFDRRVGPQRAFVRIQLALLDHLAYREVQSIETVRAMGPVLDTIIHGGVGRDVGDKAICLVQEAWLELPAFDLLDWALDVLEGIVTSQLASASVQVAFFAALHSELTRWRDRLVQSQVEVFTQLCREARIEIDLSNLDLDFGGDGETEDDIVRVLTGQTVALYSLREEALARIRKILVELVPRIDVRLFSDKVLSTRLQSAARTVDLFVIVTGAAKHAATEPIEANRPPNAATLRCHATGSAGLIRAVRDWAATVASTG